MTQVRQRGSWVRAGIPRWSGAIRGDSTTGSAPSDTAQRSSMRCRVDDARAPSVPRGWPGRDSGQVVFGDCLLGGQPAQQAGQLDALGLGQGGADLVLVAVSGGLYLAQRVA